MNDAIIQRIVDAVLYEGYMLYPYRATSLKNRQRWTFGGIYPKDYAQASRAGEPWFLQTQCLVQGNADTRIAARAGFLHLVEREVGELSGTDAAAADQDEPGYRRVDMLEIDGRRYYSWEEAQERQPRAEPIRLGELLAATRLTPFAYEGLHDVTLLRDANDAPAGVLARRRHALRGVLALAAQQLSGQLFRLNARLMNLTPWSPAQGRAAPAPLALMSSHLVLTAHGGEFLSMIDPPTALAGAAAACEQNGLWPVLVGAEGRRDTVLAAPIILEDYPRVAAESPGDLFDATEIDEILILRILTMTEQEKREMAAVDARARALLERTEALGAEQINSLHGTWRDEVEQPRLASLRVDGIELTVGAQVRLHPRRRADIFDIALDGRLATIEALERDFDDRIHVAVTIDDDPGRDLGSARMPGHRFFFAPEEVEPLQREGPVR